MLTYGHFRPSWNPETLSGIGVSLRIVFAVVLGGMYSLLGPTVGTALTIALSEWLRIVFGVKFIGMAETIDGLLLVVFIIFLPAGIYGSLADVVRRRRRPAARAGDRLRNSVASGSLNSCVKFIGTAETISGLLLVVFIIFLPAGIYGSRAGVVRRRRRPAPAPATA